MRRQRAFDAFISLVALLGGCGAETGRDDVPPTPDAVDVPAIPDAGPIDGGFVRDVPSVDRTSVDVRRDVGIDVGPDVPVDVVLEPPPPRPDNPSVRSAEATGPSSLRPRWPMTNAHVGSRRPRLRWVRPAELTGPVEITLCRDRALSVDCVRFESMTEEGRPGADLAPGRWYWRPRAGERTGATWAVRVPTATIHDRAWGGDYDADGDGLADVVAQVGTDLWWWPSGVVGLTGTGRLIATGLRIGTLAVEVGDLDGDGYSDAVSDYPIGPATFARLGRMALTRGSPVGPRLVSDAPTDQFAGRLGAEGRAMFERIGDINGDGLDDLGIYSGSVSVPSTGAYLGSPDGLSPSRFHLWDWTRGYHYESAYASTTTLCTTGMDRTGDGIADFYGRHSHILYVHGQANPYRPETFDLSFQVGDIHAGVFSNAQCATSGDADGDGTADEMYLPGIAGDFDGDGHDDELWTSWDNAVGWNAQPLVASSVDVVRNQGFGVTNDGTFGSPGDIDGDGRSDLILVSRLAARPLVFLSSVAGPLSNNGRFDLETIPPHDLDRTERFALLGDLDGDGASEILHATAATREVVPSGRSPGTRALPERLRSASTNAALLAVGDLDGDGANDLVEVTTAGAVSLHRLGLPSMVGPPTSMTLTAAQRLYAVGDLDRDGLADLVREEGGRLTVFRGVRGAVPVAGVSFAARASGPITGVVAAGDVDGDGLGDLLVDSGIDVVLTADAAARTLLESPPDEAIVPVGDVDGDGRPDLMTSSAMTQRFFRGQLGGPRELTSARRSEMHASIVALGDVTGDRLSDVGVVYTATADRPEPIHHIAILPGSVAGPDTAHEIRWRGALPAFLSPSGVAAAGDWNGDGVDDVVVTSWYSHRSLQSSTAVQVSIVGAPPSRPPITLRTH